MVAASVSPLSHPDILPLRSLPTEAPVLVVAPHPDDETLGCGGAIAALRAQGQSVSVLVVSDGTRSHPRSRLYPAPRLAQVRQAETLAALSLLGVATSQVVFLGLPDGAVPAGVSRDNPLAQVALDRCQNYLAQVTPGTVFLPYRHDPHRDHRATWSLMQAAIAGLPEPPRQIEYPIWDWDPTQRQPLEGRYRPWRLEIAPFVDLKRRAIACYRSQTTDLIADDPTGFRLSPELIANFLHPWEIFLEPVP
ncbi:PIG-L deacetylase family protein [Nodosilinea nodulosa]|uniref:PIG-L deacetylase family protein n=1 Tax=Nodosilinea nodulosa TaxID=416001 RepID=UPI0002ECC2F9|nr:PIG-L deacetylase family protein [Nodosilinea nodulosa]